MRDVYIRRFLPCVFCFCFVFSLKSRELSRDRRQGRQPAVQIRLGATHGSPLSGADLYERKKKIIFPLGVALIVCTGAHRSGKGIV